MALYFIFDDIIFSLCSELLKKASNHKFDLYLYEQIDVINDKFNSMVGCTLFAYYNLILAMFVFKGISCCQPIYIHRDILFVVSTRTNNMIIPNY